MMVDLAQNSEKNCHQRDPLSPEIGPRPKRMKRMHIDTSDKVVDVSCVGLTGSLRTDVLIIAVFILAEFKAQGAFSRRSRTKENAEAGLSIRVEHIYAAELTGAASSLGRGTPGGPEELDEQVRKAHGQPPLNLMGGNSVEKAGRIATKPFTDDIYRQHTDEENQRKCLVVRDIRQTFLEPAYQDHDQRREPEDWLTEGFTDLGDSPLDTCRNLRQRLNFRLGTRRSRIALRRPTWTISRLALTVGDKSTPCFKARPRVNCTKMDQSQDQNFADVARNGHTTRAFPPTLETHSSDHFLPTTRGESNLFRAVPEGSSVQKIVVWSRMRFDSSEMWLDVLWTALEKRGRRIQPQKREPQLDPGSARMRAARKVTFEGVFEGGVDWHSMNHQKPNSASLEEDNAHICLNLLCPSLQVDQSHKPLALDADSAPGPICSL
ncbi:hypothetical protein B0H17DRAFT_1302054 [Mycena rosella]|uniref:Uncharacterized protein n=1 Tax=Mycena rosella TaxID=1033263 RepID=A0AAD7GTL4_MYCRO|nr:hypothetical protein B0H17DRAFT_1302054 [Mycena rosella]